MGLVEGLDRLRELSERLKSEGKRVVFTNGCFDILHAGHVDYLERAKSLGDVLIVGVNSDVSVRKIKGDKRPIVPEEMRVRVLLGLKAVDYVVLFDEENPLKVIEAVRPNVLVKGADWPLEKIVGREFADEVVRIPFRFDISTSKIVERVVERYCGGEAPLG
ncbi:rfaE bifunctional protein [Thermovibrio ammonificans HB-1]|uniref:D-glycero-beta-D-manno-heptose 1-phosphate adenylyltransferase n=1 Tax=Thermovibrio ammonificans (strain DSM 15698 / JCM 12110 / HB-1) TaxID=648996 RepID=E8T3X5_THEA1|nr:D-glycero-beta-D-manno-heptose 1-phosphate adenylyltransferase [Thermovibrio ammonificans]ADU96185.1 rfaE bifunctional protein [Thermovibrio ammonificans HB-1]